MVGVGSTGVNQRAYARVERTLAVIQRAFLWPMVRVEADFSSGRTVNRIPVADNFVIHVTDYYGRAVYHVTVPNR
jgi:hypothetical protein